MHKIRRGSIEVSYQELLNLILLVNFVESRFNNVSFHQIGDARALSISSNDSTNTISIHFESIGCYEVEDGCLAPVHKIIDSRS